MLFDSCHYVSEHCRLRLAVVHNCSDTADQVMRLPLPDDYCLEALGHVSHALLRSAATVR